MFKVAAWIAVFFTGLYVSGTTNPLFWIRSMSDILKSTKEYRKGLEGRIQAREAFNKDFHDFFDYWEKVGHYDLKTDTVTEEMDVALETFHETAHYNFDIVAEEMGQKYMDEQRWIEDYIEENY